MLIFVARTLLYAVYGLSLPVEPVTYDLYYNDVMRAVGFVS